MSPKLPFHKPFAKLVDRFTHEDIFDILSGAGVTPTLSVHAKDVKEWQKRGKIPHDLATYMRVNDTKTQIENWKADCLKATQAGEGMPQCLLRLPAFNLDDIDEATTGEVFRSKKMTSLSLLIGFVFVEGLDAEDRDSLEQCDYDYLDPDFVAKVSAKYGDLCSFSKPLKDRQEALRPIVNEVIDEILSNAEDLNRESIPFAIQFA